MSQLWLNCFMGLFCFSDDVIRATWVIEDINACYATFLHYIDGLCRQHYTMLCEFVQAGCHGRWEIHSWHTVIFGGSTFIYIYIYVCTFINRKDKNQWIIHICNSLIDCRKFLPEKQKHHVCTEKKGYSAIKNRNQCIIFIWCQPMVRNKNYTFSI